MRLLFLTPQLPYPPRQGATLRNFHLLAGLARYHEIDLLTFLAPGETLIAANLLHSLCRRIATAPQPLRTPKRRAWETFTSARPDMAHRLDSPEMHALLRAWMQECSYDGIQFEGIEMAPYLATALDVIGERVTRPRLVFDNHNCEYLLQKRNALNDLRVPRRLPAGFYSTIQWWKLRRYERWACRAADVTLAVSRPDAAALRELMSRKRDHNTTIHVIPNGIAAAEVAAGENGQPDRSGTTTPVPTRLVFTGKMDYRPNIDAVLWFVRSVLPKIVAVHPQTLFQIVGMNPHPRLLPLADSPHVQITGAVEDIKPYIQDAAIFVIPLRVGGGTRFKVLEALAAGKATVSTSLGVEGIDVKDGEHLRIADSPSEFAQAVLDFIADQVQHNGSLTRRMGVQARAFIATHYTWDSIVPALSAIYKDQG